MFLALGARIPAIRGPADKKKWSESMDKLIMLRGGGTVGDAVDHLLSVQRPRVPDAVERLET